VTPAATGPGGAGAIAIVGAGLRLPGGVDTLAGWWEALAQGRDLVGPVPPDRWDPTRWDTPPAGGFLRDPLRFDAAFFGISDREAAELDPAQRLLLEVAWEALEQGGVAPDQLVGSRTGVWVGLGLSDWSRRHFGGPDPARLGPHSGTGSLLSVAAGRIAYALGLQGPALTVDTACSSSLVALHLAVQSLRRGEVDLALAGGASLQLHPMPSVWFRQVGALSADGRCRTFDAAADGYGRADGVGLLALVRAADAAERGLPVLALVHGTAVNQDGRTSGLTAPSGAAQQAVIRAALADAGARPDDVAYVEAHGTGTPLGDPVEVDALRAVFLPRERPLHLGSAKTVVGHAEAAAGVVGVLKAALALRHRAIPPHLHLHTPNPRLRLDGLVIDTALGPLPPGLVGVSAFGLAGTNAHAVLGPAPDRPPPVDDVVVVPVSGRTPSAAEATARRWADALPEGLEGVAAAAAARASLPHRAFAVASTRQELADRLRRVRTAPAPRRPPTVAFLCSGQGSQVAGAGLALAARDPAARRALEEVAAAVDAATGERPLLDVLRDEGAMSDTRWTQPATLALHVCLAAWWRARGVVPDLLVGHSIGELSAAVLAGVWSVADGARLAVARGRLLGALPRGGAMWAVLAPEDVVRERLGDAPLDVAAVNHAAETVLAGRSEDLEAARGRFAGLDVRPLRVSHAFHSRWVEPAQAAFHDVVRTVVAREPQVPVVSAVDGRLLGARALDPAFWRDHVRATVRFADALRTAHDEGATVFVELAGRPVATGLVERVLGPVTAVPTLRPPAPEVSSALGALGAVWVAGVDVAFPRAPMAADLPPGVFEGRVHTLDGPAEVLPASLPRWVEVDAPAPPVTEVAPRVHVVTEREPVEGVVGFARALRPGANCVSAALRTDEHPIPAGVGSGAPPPTPPPEDSPSPGSPLQSRDSVADATSSLHWTVAPRTVTGAAVYGAWLALAAEDPARAGGFVWADGDVPPHALGRPGVVQVRGGEVLGVARGPAPAGSGRLRLGGGPILVTGATGGLGPALLRWLAGRGAREVVLVSRSGRVPTDLPPGLAARGVALDLREPGPLAELAASLEGLAGVVHAAGLTDDAAFDALRAAPDGAERWAAPLAVKAGAAAALDAATRGRGLPLFLALSSAAAWIGSPGQAAYGAANAALEQVVRERVAAGEPAHAVALGPIAGTGLADVPPAVVARWARAGVPLTTVPQALAALDAALDGPPGVSLAGDFGRAAVPAPPPGQRPLAERVADDVRAVLGWPADRALDPDVGLFELGLDSITAAELQRLLAVWCGRAVSPTAVFDHPTLTRLVAHLQGGDAPGVRPAAAPAAGPIAIVGWACRLPGGVRAPEDLWPLLRAGEPATGPVPADRFAPDELGRAPRTAAWVGDLFTFDPAAHGLSPAEAAALDPAHRLLLDCARDALAGLPRSPDTGVWVGVEPGDYARRLPIDDPYALVGNQPSVASGRLAHTFGWEGPAVSVDTACSSGLVALAQAVRELRAGAVGRAVVGAAHALTGPEGTRALAALGALSPRGACRPFDAAADGYVRGEGCVVLVLEPLARARAAGRPVLGVIDGVAVGHDGAAAGLTVPTGPAQARVLRAALHDAGLGPDDVDAIEAHGTGTRLGDPVEWGALADVFAGRDPARGAVQVGAAKAVVGHLEAAAGLVGVLAGLLRLHRGEAPPVAGLTTPNPLLAPSPALHLPTAPEPSAARRVGVSAFGIAGTDAHVLLSAPDPLPPPAPRPPPTGTWVGVPHPSLLLPRQELRRRAFTPALRPAADDVVLDLGALEPRGPSPVDDAERLVLAHARLLATVREGARVVLVTRGADLDPVDGALAGLAATAAVEWTRGGYAHVDLPPGPVSAELLEVVRRAALPRGTVVVRDGAWWVPELVPAPAAGPGTWTGPVLVTGAGGLATALLAPGGRGLGRQALDLATADADAVRAAWGPGPWPATVLHAAGAPADAPLEALDEAVVRAAFGARVRGALALRAAFPDAAHHVVGSAAAVVGNPGQGAYAAAHGFLAALGAVLLGPVAGPGLAAGRDWGARGVRPLAPGRVAEALRAGGVTLDVDWPTWARSVPHVPAVVAARCGSAPARLAVDAGRAVRDALAAVLGEAPDDDRGFFEAGLDSLGVVAVARRLDVAPALLFDHPTARRLTAALTKTVAPAPLPAVATSGEVVLTAAALRLPGDVRDLDGLHELLASGRDVLGPTPPERWSDARHPELAGRDAAWLAWDEVQGFDPEAFGVSAREAAAMDPQHRLLLALAVEALQRAGLRRADLAGRRVAVFVGAGDSGYLDRFQRPGEARYADPHAGTGNLSAFASGRISHALGLTGPNLTLNTACSSALVAVHLARRALLDGEADVALAGAVHLMLSPEHARVLARLNATSPTGRCRPFDADADGYARGEGAGLFVLQRGSDAARPLARLVGSAVGHDGAAAGLTAPSGPAQEDVIRRALADAGRAPDDVDTIEAHGTGTPLGDPIEVDALHRVFGDRPPDRPLQLGSVKSNLGHLEVAAGVASLAKVLGGFAHGEWAPTLHLRRPSPALHLAERGYVVPTQRRAWSPGLVGVSGFGLSGTNVHLVLAPVAAAPVAAPEPGPGPALLCLSAPSAASLRATLAASPRDRAAAHAALAHRDPGRFRAAAVGDHVEPGGPVPPEGPTALLFTGQGSQAPGMGRGLAEAFPAVREVFDEARDVLAGDLWAAWDDDRVHHTRYTQPALVVLEVALARWWASLGVVPDVVAGHSAGQLAAAVVAGALPFARALRLVERRATLLASLPAGGAMVAVDAGEELVRRHLADGVSLAAVHHAESCTISGPAAAVEVTAASLRAAGARTTALPVSHAFHSALVDPVVAEWTAACRAEPWATPRCTWLSALDGRPVTDPGDVLGRELRAPVRFGDVLATLSGRSPRLVIEVGPHPVLAGMAAREVPGARIVATLRHGQGAVEAALHAAAKAWVAGAGLRAEGLFPGQEAPPPSAAPVVRWGRARCWLEEPVDDGGMVLTEAWAPVEVAASGFAGRVTGDGDVAGALRAAVTPGAAEVLVLEAVPGAVARALDAVRRGVAAVVTVGGTGSELLGVHGLLRAAAAEDPRRAPRWLDVDPGVSPASVASALAAGLSDVHVREGGVFQRVLARASLPASPPATFPPTLVTGGTSGVGLAVAKALRLRGAPLVLVGRRPADEALRAWVAEPGPPVHLVQGDVGERAVVDAAVAAVEGLAAGGPVGVVHAAGALADRPLDAITADDLAATAAGKVQGFRHLDARLGEVVFLLAFGAGAALLGAPGQGAYAAANAALAGACRARGARGARVVLVHWGAWDEVGMAARLSPELRRRRAERGLGALSVAEGTALALRALAWPQGEVAVLPTDWGRYVATTHGGVAPPLLAGLVPAGARPSAEVRAAGRARERLLAAGDRAEAAQREVSALVRRILRREGPLGVDDPLGAAGLDSLLSIELKNALFDEGFDVPVVTILADPTVRSLASVVEAGLAPAVQAAGTEEPAVSPLVTHAVALALGVFLVVAAYVGTAWLVGYAE
jgi:acyl transferase domain-containing protein/NAD(P)-dependent dehydrogenase (short-subunit alcohol dehydrogenase family)